MPLCRTGFIKNKNKIKATVGAGDEVELINHLSSLQEAQRKPGVVACSTGEVETGRSEVQGHLQLLRELQVNLG